MSEFTYRSARSGRLVGGMGLVIGVETIVMHLWLRLHYPLLAWSLTAASVWAIGWLAADYQALGRGGSVSTLTSSTSGSGDASPSGCRSAR
jgi:hypothetical protein